MQGKVAIVTGGGQGIGQGIALALAEAGAQVYVTGRTEDKLHATCAEIARRGDSARAIRADVKVQADLEAVVAACMAKAGRIDVLVNNAQEVPNGTLDTVDDDKFVAGFESGPLAVLRLMKLVRPHMAAGGGGTIFNLVSSVGERWDMTGYGAYAAVKQAIRALTRAAAAEWGRENIRVLNIAPHAESAGLKKWVENNPVEAAAFFKTIPLGRIVDCEADIGRAVVALCGENLGYLTGATIPLDGGQAYFA